MRHKIFGFSLAEMMIVLLMVAIALAATAPMMTKRVSANRAAKIFRPLNNAGWAQHAVYFDKGIGAGLNKQKIFMTNDGALGGIGLTTNGIASLQPYSVLVGNVRPANSAVALGYNITTSTGGIAVGSGTVAGDHGVAIGEGVLNGDAAYATQYGNVAIGFNAKARGSNGAIALGYGSSASGNEGAVAVGLNSRGTGNYSTAVGNNAQAIKHASSAFGVSSIASGEYSTAMGYDAKASQHASSAYGVSSRANGQYSTAVGNNAQANYASSAFGSSSQASGSYTTALGYNAIASGYNSAAIGAYSRAWHTNSMAIGQGSQTDRSNEIMLGTAWQTVKIPGTLQINSLTLPGNLLVKGDVALATDRGHNIYMRENTPGYRWYCRVRFIWCWSWVRYTVINQRLAHPTATAATFETEDNSDEVAHIYQDDTRSMIYDIADENIYINGQRVSDRRLKNIGEKYTDGLDALAQLDLYNYTLKNDKNKTPYVGVMAQDLQKVFPTSVTTDEKSGYLQIRWDEMFYATINAVKELDAKLITLVNQVEEKIKELVDLKATIKNQQQTIETQQQIITQKQQQLKDLRIRVEKLEKRK